MNNEMVIVYRLDDMRVAAVVSVDEKLEYKSPDYAAVTLQNPTGDVIIGDQVETLGGTGFVTYGNSVLRNIEEVMMYCYNMRNGPENEIARRCIEINKKINEFKI
jgi:hypothetical protein